MAKDLFSLKGKNIVVTGASGLLGRQHVDAIALYGGTPILLDLNSSILDIQVNELKEKYKIEAFGYVVNITDEISVQKNCQMLIENFGKIEITSILKPYTEEYLIKNYFYNSIVHYEIINKKKNEIINKKQHINYLHKIYNSITPNIVTICLIQNRLPIYMFLPNELWINILEFCQLKELFCYDY